ncbi:MAG TPA: hypothetical protein VGH44_05770 [Candidatus Saccharimonadia bacterium]
MQRIIVFLGLVLLGGSWAAGAHWPSGVGPTIPRPDLAATASPVASPSPNSGQVPMMRRTYTPTPSATPIPSATPSPSASPSPTPEASAIPSPSPSPSPACGTCGGNRKPGMMCPMFCANN